MTEATAVRETHLPGLELVARGKVRDVYAVPPGGAAGPRLLLVATDRISAFDVVLPTAVPRKGVFLNQLSAFWFEKLQAVADNHLVTVRPAEMPSKVKDLARGLGGRAALVERAQVVPVECVVRGYLASSVEKAYRATGEIQGVKLPKGIPLGGKLPEPIFTPTTKEKSGHDVPLTYAELEAKVGKPLAAELKATSLAVFRAASAHCESVGVLLADTKLELGHVATGELAIVDELLTPDSSRFFKAKEHEPGKPPVAWDKQLVRDYLLSLPDWNKQPPGPPLPDEIVVETARRYREVLEILAGRSLDEILREQREARRP